ncbi:hypothetical protein NBRC10513_006705 [Rhodotorula toruloides]
MEGSDAHPSRPSRRHRSSSPTGPAPSSRHVQRLPSDGEYQLERELEDERELRRQRRMRRDSRRREESVGRGLEAVERWREDRGAGYRERRGRDKVDERSEDSEDEEESDSETGEGSSLLGSSRGRGRRRSRDDDLEFGESAPPSRSWNSRARSPGVFRRSVSPPLDQIHPRLPSAKPQSQPPPLARAPPSSRRPINVDFRFPTSFSHSGLPSYPHSQYLPLRLLSPTIDPNSPEARHQAELREEEAGWRRNNRHQSVRRDHVDEDGEENLVFPALLACVLVLVPVLVVTVVLGAVFTAAKVDA